MKSKEEIRTEEIENRYSVLCKTCKYCRDRERPGLVSKEEPYRYKICCKLPPSVDGFPVVAEDDYCGEHKFWEESLNE